MATETARIIDLAEYRRRLRPEAPAPESPAGTPMPSAMVTVWVPVMPMMAMVPFWTPPRP